PITLTLRPGGVVRVTVRAPDGTPASGVALTIVSAGGAPMASEARPVTDTRGTARLQAPAGAVEIHARRDPLSGIATVEVPTGRAVTAEITLGKAPDR